VKLVAPRGSPLRQRLQASGKAIGVASRHALLRPERFEEIDVLSTLASYRLISNNLPRQLSIVAQDPQVARETEYYRTHIGDVKSVDDFIDDQRLFSYAMKAYGLDDMTFAKAFMKKVLQSDLNDDKSFANQLTDKRYLEFAKAFHFLPSGDVDAGQSTAQDGASEDAMIGLYSQHRLDKGALAGTEADYFKSRIAGVTSVDQLLSDKRLFDFALVAYGIDPDLASVSAIRNVLTSDLSDPASVANQYGGDYLNLAAAFSFETDGSVASGGAAQTSAQTGQTTLAYFEATGTDESPAAAAFKTGYFDELVSSITNVDDLVANHFLRGYIASAAGLDPVTTAPATMRDILLSDLSDPDSAANANAAYKAVAETFNFNSDGSLDAGVPAQDADQAETLANLFLANYDDQALADEADDTSYYRLNIGNVIHVDDLLKDSRLYNYMLSSFGIDPDEVTKSQIKRALLSDASSSTSYASFQSDSRLRQLSDAFNFNSDGYTLGVSQAQTDAGKDSTVARFTATLGDLKIDQQLGEGDTAYYKEAMDSVTSVDDLLQDQRLTSYIIKAYGLKSDISKDTLRKILTSDRLDRDSYVNKSNNTDYQALAADFNFDSDGAVIRSQVGVAQDHAEVVTTEELYFRQSVEERAGNDNEGVRLALYFARKAAGIDSAYDILADKALLQVTQTALGLPETISLLDIDKQADLISDRLDFADLQDPDKLQQFLTRFSAKWDIDNSDTTSSSNPAVVLLSQTTDVGIGLDLLTSLQSLRLGGA
jgi:hypothetical protein